MDELRGRLAAALATPDGFRSWLTGLPAHEPAGEPRESCRCPLARWLSHVGGVPVRVGIVSVRLEHAAGDAERVATLTPWAQSFRGLFDLDPQRGTSPAAVASTLEAALLNLAITGCPGVTA